MTDIVEEMAREIIVCNHQLVGSAADYAYADQILSSDDAGDAGEAFAARQLAQAAYTIVERRIGELQDENRFLKQQLEAQNYPRASLEQRSDQ